MAMRTIERLGVTFAICATLIIVGITLSPGYLPSQRCNYSDGTVPVIYEGLTILDFEQKSVGTSATSPSMTAIDDHECGLVRFSITTTALRARGDATVPTSTTGVYYPVDTLITCTWEEFKALEWISTHGSNSGVLNVHYLGRTN